MKKWLPTAIPVFLTSLFLANAAHAQFHCSATCVTLARDLMTRRWEVTGAIPFQFATMEDSEAVFRRLQEECDRLERPLPGFSSALLKDYDTGDAEIGFLTIKGDFLLRYKKATKENLCERAE